MRHILATLCAVVCLLGWLPGCGSIPIPIPQEPVVPFDCDNPPDPPASLPQIARGVYSSMEAVGDDSYIVVYRDEVIGDANAYAARAMLFADAREFGAKGVVPLIGMVNGFVGVMTKREAKHAAKDPRVLGVFQNGVKTIPPGETASAEQVEPAARISWGQDRIDDLTPGGDGTYEPRNHGEDVVIGILDTGIDDDSADFEGRIVYCDTVQIDAFMCRDDGIQSSHGGHGTHVAGTAAGTTWGVAPRAKIASIRVLDHGSGSDAEVINGVNMMVTWWEEQGQQHGHSLVVNMSLGGPPSWPLDWAVCKGIARGVHFALAAGNVDNSACHNSPARVVQAITTGSTDSDDSRSYFSATDGDTETNPETGRPWCEGIIDRFCPGANILSTKIGCRKVPCFGHAMSGTSMASPHSAGTAAIMLSENGPMAPKDLVAALQHSDLPVVTDPRSLHNGLCYAGPLD
jgi:subtilisin family serine protease